MFKVGDIVVYPAHGVAEVESVEDREISGSTMSFIILKILDTQMTVMVPVANVKNVGIRELIRTKGIDQVMDILKQRSVQVDNQTWNRRYREYMEKIKSGSAFEIAEVLRDLNILKRGKELSFGERKMYDTAKNLLVNEISISKKLDRKDAEMMILSAMGKIEQAPS
ncbi:MAG TPA: CarD family transcriptional regulator [Deltaproteobacteria bacterium]|nr:CarD family transcriptional regulator [Deltaproteobacteria bacterium]